MTAIIDLPRPIGNDLMLRQATTSDAEALADFNAHIHSDEGWEHPDWRVAAWTHDLLSRPHPTFQPEDFTVVEEISSGRIVSSLNLISQTWEFDGIPFGVGRPELVGTRPEYRQRGLVRLQFDEIHRWSAGRGEMVQAITGIPYYYRQFGYEMALNLGGGRSGYRAQMPRLAEGTPEPYRVRPARTGDLAFLDELYQAYCRRSVVSVPRSPALWQYELDGKSELNVNRLVLMVIETPDGETVGFLAHPPFNWGPSLVVSLYELKPGVPYSAVNPSVIRYLYATADAQAVRDSQDAPVGAISFNLGAQHPAYDTLSTSLPRVRPPYAFFMRVPDLPAFIRHIAPVLEARLSASPYSGYSGEFKLSFYRRGLRWVFENGRLARVEDWKPEPQGHSGEALFPDLTFLQLLFGYRSLDELRYAFADVGWINDDIYGLVKALFPRQDSDLWAVA